MSAATADRLLSSQRKLGQRGLSTTQAGTLLKQQIPFRTFEEWKETQPGFLEADLVAQCGTDIEGGYLYTLTLTDVATGWTECLPLLHRSQEAVLAAIQRERTLFPFPILGIDTDNGGEFINEVMVAYCEQEQITFTRGLPYQKRDQCFVEQKNAAIIRPVVGYHRLVGEQAYRQLTELYQALRLYDNCFQPSMKLFLAGCQSQTEQWRHLPGVAAPLPWTLSPLANPHTPARHAQDPSIPASETFEEQWQDEVIRGPCLRAVSSAENEALVT